MRLPFVLCGISLVLGVPAQDEPPDPTRTTVLRAVDWIARQAVPLKGENGAVAFPGTAERPRQQTPVVYGGTAGVLIFLENAAVVLQDDRCRQLADATAKGLLARRQTDAEDRPTWASSITQDGAAGLYTGDAGIGHAFLVRARLRGDAAALQTAVETGDALVARAERDGDTMSWDDQVEVIYGAAGTALFLLELGDATGEARFRDAAVAVGRWLVSEAETVPDAEPPQLSWRWQLAGNAAYVNFSHGTAGVAYALARIAAATGDDACARAAKNGAEWLLARAIRDGDLLCFPVVAGSQKSLASWCHGPPGTARLFLLLHQQTGESRYLDAAIASARWVMQQADAATGAAGASQVFPPSFCCGVAGVIDFFCDLYRATGQQPYADFARRAGQYLVQAAVVDGDGVKWQNGRSAHDSNPAQHNVDLMLGASGEAFALLRLLTLDAVDDPVRGMPDRFVGKR